MGLLVECPECKKRNSPKTKTCKCGVTLGKYSGKAWWIEYYLDGKRKRERIGSSKKAAEQRYREVRSAIAEGRYITKSPDTINHFQDLADWYLQLPEAKAKSSYDRDELSLKHLLPYFGDKLLKDITPSLIEAYRHKRLKEPSGRSPKKLTQSATVNRETALMKTIFNKAIANGKAEKYPLKGIKPLKENNERDRVLSPEEYTLLLAHSPAHLKPIIKTAYYTAMRQGEILNLTWGQVDLDEGFIHLRQGDTKTGDGRHVPLTDELVKMFKAMREVIPLPHVKVFTYAGKSVGSIKRAFATACKNAGIEDFTFHDLRHTAINNWRLQGHDPIRIMKASGHKTMHMFKRYSTVDKDELKALVR